MDRMGGGGGEIGLKHIEGQPQSTRLPVETRCELLYHYKVNLCGSADKS
jgi:hypothetical protein